MTNDEILTFLTIVKTKNISKAAEQLFISQSTTSQRLKSLENELGIQLIERHKGFKAIELTNEGTQFIEIAEQYHRLYNESQALKETSGKLHLSLGCSDNLTTYFFTPLLLNFAQDIPNLMMDVKILNSDEIYRFIEKKELDIGLLVNPMNNSCVFTKLLHEERMVVITSTNFPKLHPPVTPEQLRPEQEIYLNWGSEYSNWHTFWFHTPHANINVNTISLLLSFLSSKNGWAIVPISVAIALQQQMNFKIYELDTPVPPRTCYEITHKYPRNSRSEAINLFLKKLYEYIPSLNY